MRKLLLALSIVPATFAQDKIIWGLLETDVADIRVGPDFAYPIILQVPRDTSVQKRRCSVSRAG